MPSNLLYNPLKKSISIYVLVIIIVSLFLDRLI